MNSREPSTATSTTSVFFSLILTGIYRLNERQLVELRDRIKQRLMEITLEGLNDGKD